MESPAATSLLHHIEQLVTVHSLANLSDRDLLRRFADGRDDASFSAIVSRHGSMVWHVCQRVLHNESEAEDAFQATFLVLARKAASSRWHESVANWLYQVAIRLARRAKASARTRQSRESNVRGSPSMDPVGEITLREAQAILDEELVQMPERFRAPLVLCYLENATRDDAARQLGWSLGTLKRRLECGRELLRVRLTRRGLTLSAALLTATLVQSTTRAAVPSGLAAFTVKAALAYTAGKMAAGVVAPEVAKLVEGLTNALWATKLKVVATLVLTVGLLTAGAGLAAHRALTTEPPETKSETPPQPPAKDSGAGKPAKEGEARLDNFGDPLPPGALVRMGTVRYAQGDTTDGSPVLAPDHRTFVTVSNFTPYRHGRVICLWDADTGKELRHIDDPDFEYYQAFFLKSENLLGTLGVSRKPVQGDKYAYVMHFWDRATGKKASDHIEATGYPFEPWAFSPDEKWLASASREPPVLIRERKTGKVLAEWKGDGTRVNHLAFSSDGNTVAFSCGTAIHLWDWKDNGDARRLGDLPKDEVERLWYSPDGRWIAVAIYKEGLRIWETKELTEVRRIEGVHDVRFFPDGKRLVSTETGVILDIASGKQLGKFEDCAHCVTLDFSPDGRTATGYALGRIRRWDAETGKDQSPPALSAHHEMVHQIGFLPDGKAVVSATPNGAVRVWDATTGKELRALVRGRFSDDQPTYMRVGPDGTVVVARGNRLSFFKGEGKAEEVTLKDFPEGGLASLNLSPDGKYLILAGGTNEKRLVQLWDLPGRKVVTSFPPTEQTSLEVLGVSSSKSVAAHVGDCVCLLNGKTGAIERTLDKRPETPSTKKPGEKGVDAGGGYSYFPGIHALTFSSEGDVLVAAGHPAGGLKLLDVDSSRTRHVLLPPSSGNHYELHNAVFSPDGQMIAAESESGVVDVWETSSGQRRRRFLGHRSYQTTLAFSPDGARLATGNRDATILIWDVFGVATANPKDAAPLTEEELKTLWTCLQDEDAGKACLAMGRLMRWPDVSGPFLKRQLLSRKSPEVAKLKAWIADLDESQFGKRETASTELAKRLAMVEPLLKEKLTSKPSTEARRRIEDLLSRVGSDPLPPETIRDLRALEVLEHIAPAAVGDLTRELRSEEYDPLVRAAAQAARKRLATKAP